MTLIPVRLVEWSNDSSNHFQWLIIGFNQSSSIEWWWTLRIQARNQHDWGQRWIRQPGPGCNWWRLGFSWGFLGQICPQSLIKPFCILDWFQRDRFRLHLFDGQLQLLRICKPVSVRIGWKIIENHLIPDLNSYIHITFQLQKLAKTDKDQVIKPDITPSPPSLFNANRSRQFRGASS